MLYVQNHTDGNVIYNQCDITFLIQNLFFKYIQEFTLSGRANYSSDNFMTKEGNSTS